ncbi:hypothetical protein LNV23_04385 [Paucibacter sp. DJ1R-11]|uniref:hypothetical protein n=1 Tax=Paucibacter sp. DJ1R-11 TaxID=2893556 RepID=UPI0021E49120|nr:hypothetical protein [Paucibacter sp. DJ1R-11]MCV2362686.1 hypothetical protein [Paucibacter sp. DJ1R-11]
MRTQFQIAAVACALLMSASFSRADEVLIEEAGLSMTLPVAWVAKYETSRIPSGQLMQRWVRAPVALAASKASPGLIALVSPVPKNSNLALLSQNALSKPPYGLKLGVETQCVKCVNYKFKTNGAIVTSVAPDVPPKCQEYKPDIDIESDCIYQLENRINLTIEPSWAHRFEKEAAFGKMFILSIHAIVDNKFIDISFFYPKETADQIQPEIAAIAASIKKVQR